MNDTSGIKPSYPTKLSKINGNTPTARLPVAIPSSSGNTLIATYPVTLQPTVIPATYPPSSNTIAIPAIYPATFQTKPSKPIYSKSIKIPNVIECITCTLQPLTATTII